MFFKKNNIFYDPNGGGVKKNIYLITIEQHLRWKEESGLFLIIEQKNRKNMKKNVSH